MNRYLRTRIRTTVWEAQRIRRLTQSRSYTQGSFGMIAEKGTDLNGKRLFRPWWITIESVANVKGMGVILHGLCPVPINRWTVLPYSSRWLGICFCVTLVLLLFIKSKVSNVIRYCSYVGSHLYNEKYMHNNIVVIHIIPYDLHASFVVNKRTYIYVYVDMMKVCPSWPSSKDYYTLGEIMLRRTKGINI
jgi:hypothetical protein